MRCLEEGRKGRKGSKWSRESKKRFSEKCYKNPKRYWFGKKRSMETRQKISDKCKGANHSKWKGGISKLMESIRSLFFYRLWRSDVFTRDNYMCKNCGSNKKIESHHIVPFHVITEKYAIKTIPEALMCEELWNINNGVTLCKNCHRREHGSH